MHSSLPPWKDPLCCVQVPKEVLLPEAVTQVAAGSGHTLFLTESAHVWAAGSNRHGQLGLGRADAISSMPRRLQALVGVPRCYACISPCIDSDLIRGLNLSYTSARYKNCSDCSWCTTLPRSVGRRRAVHLGERAQRLLR
jgi:hypothetical protein